MKKRKNYTLVENNSSEPSIIDGPCPWVWKTATQKLDFNRWNHFKGKKTSRLVDRGMLLDQLRNAIWGLRHEMSEASVINLFENGLATLFRFIDSSETQIFSIDDFNEEHFISYVLWLKQSRNLVNGKQVSYVTARRRFTVLKTILSFYSRKGLFDNRLFPTNPFPNANRAAKGVDPYSKDEMTRIVRCLYYEYRLIKSGKTDLSPRLQMAIYQYLIIAKTGLNKTPLEEASRDCLQPHPLHPDKAKVLITRKRRGMNTHVTSMRLSQEVEDVNGMPNSVARLFEEAIEMTNDLVCHAKEEDKNKIWLYRSGSKNTVSAYKGTYLSGAAQNITKRHELVNDQGQPLTISSTRLRKTFATRIWQLTNGDVWKTARILGNSPKVTDRHYLDVTPEMERQHHFLGKALELKIRGSDSDKEAISVFASDAGLSETEAEKVISGEYNTGVARCSSPFHGKYAKSDGSPCTRFIDCFRCPNQIVLESDLYRLYSFYWLLLSERSALGKKRWKRLYGWVIREIDNAISNAFDETVVKQAKDSARTTPHPMWKDRSIIGGIS